MDIRSSLTLSRQQVGKSHVDGHRSDHAAAAETDGSGSSGLQRCFITASGSHTIHDPAKNGGPDTDHFLITSKFGSARTDMSVNSFWQNQLLATFAPGIKVSTVHGGVSYAHSSYVQVMELK